MKRSKTMTVILVLFFGVVILAAILPFISVVSVAFSTETDIGTYGFSLIPRNVSLRAFELLFENPQQLIRCAVWTLFLALVLPILGAILSGLAAYPISTPNFKFSGAYRKYLIYTMLISAGGIPSYVLNTRYYGLYDNPLVFFVGIGGSAWGIFLYRTFFKDVPREMIEAAEIDGAGEFQILWKIMLPSAKAIFAMQYTLGFIGNWNSTDPSLYYIENPDYYQIQYYLKKILDDITLLKQSLAQYGNTGGDFPTVTIQYATLCITLVPVFILFPYMQKFFTKGIAASSVKG